LKSIDLSGAGRNKKRPHRESGTDALKCVLGGTLGKV
jgi:hypothetical protein